MTDATAEAGSAGRFKDQLMSDALFLREYIAKRGLYSKEVLGANKALLAAIEKAETEPEDQNFTADTENAVLAAMSDVLLSLKCSRLDDLRRADSAEFRRALSVGRILVFATMLLCISLALPLTLAFNQLTAMTKEIDAAFTDDVLRGHVDNSSKHWLNQLMFPTYSQKFDAGQGDLAEEDWKAFTDEFNEFNKSYDLTDFQINMQIETWRSLATPPAILSPLFRILKSWNSEGSDSVDDVIASEEDSQVEERLSGPTVDYSLGQQLALFKSEIVPVKRQGDALTFLLNNALLPLLYGMLGSAVFLSRRYMSAETELLSSNPVTDALMRIGLGGMAGLVVGWFQTPDGVVELTTTPFVIAFVAGFSIDIVFSLLERVVMAFDFRQPA